MVNSGSSTGLLPCRCWLSTGQSWDGGLGLGVGLGARPLVGGRGALGGPRRPAITILCPQTFQLERSTRDLPDFSRRGRHLSSKG
jgi:hypothetical protein